MEMLAARAEHPSDREGIFLSSLSRTKTSRSNQGNDSPSAVARPVHATHEQSANETWE